MLTVESQPAFAITATGKSFLANLKTGTSQQHEQLEAQELLAAIMSPSVTVQQYCSYLLLMQNIERVYEAEILPVCSFLFPEKVNRKASELIDADLQYINSEMQTDHFQQYTLSLPYNTASLALGFMYVMEGSKLGGRIICKHIRKTLGFAENGGAAFLSNTGADTGKEWMHFLAAFSSFITAQYAAAEAIEGAKRAFDSIYQYYESNRLFYAD